MKTILKARGPYTRPDTRRIMVIYYEDGSRSTMTYARYLVLQSQKLDAEEVVHHINEDKTDDRLENYEVLTNSEHVKKHNPKQYVTLVCEYCGSSFTKLASWEKRQARKRTAGPYCSRHCQGKVHN